MEVAYDKAVKRVCNLNVWDSNHSACDMIGVDIFKHLYAKRKIDLIFSLINSQSPCLQVLKYYFYFSSLFSRDTSNFFFAAYGIVEVFENPMCAILSLIDFIQRNEPRLSALRDN